MKPVTAWDGVMTVVHLSEENILHVGLQTSERVRERTVRPGLTLAFAEDDTGGPPVRVRACLPVPSDVLQLLGDRCTEAVRRVLSGPERVAWVQLDLENVQELAQAWTPYRTSVLAPDPGVWLPRVGRLAQTLWTLVQTPRPVVRSGPAHRGTTGEWWLPEELAAQGGVHPRVIWDVQQASADPTATVRAACMTDSCRLEIAMDDGAAGWIAFAADDDGEVLARLPARDVLAGKAVRFRVRAAAGQCHPEGSEEVLAP
ncbi:hypothetical protein [Streptomyces europaeiscabiei]|uniref:hypothetical protein n=1 Tax=Streptomyces europaeiscabiei TaxID=146819 RepID=UPI002E2B2F0E|nr:hypothetical protein [Streptomyces europaeiscabiei]